MKKHEVRTPEHALAYLVDCQLATVAELAMKKSRGKADYARQKSIAQTGVWWVQRMTNERPQRVADALIAGSVDAWVLRFECGR